MPEIEHQGTKFVVDEDGFIDWELLSLTIITMVKDQTQPVGFGRPAILHAPLPGPDGNSS